MKKIVICLMVIMLLCSCVEIVNSDSPSTPKTVSASTATESKKIESDPEPKTIEYTAELSNGNYVAGIDFPAGKYNFVAIKGKGNVSSDNMFSGGINEMMGVGDEMYETEYSNVNLIEGTTLRISSGVVIEISCDKASGAALASRNQSITETVTLKSGHFVSGEDFPAGIYNVVAISGKGNVSSDNMFSGGINAMMGVGDDFYETEYKNIDFPDGVTLSISGVEIDLVPSK